MTHYQVLKEFWGKSLKWKLSIIKLFARFPAFAFHELCHLLFLEMYMILFNDFQKLDYTGSYFLKKLGDNYLGGYSLAISYTSYSKTWAILVSLAPFIGYLGLWIVTLTSFVFGGLSFLWFMVSVRYLIFAFGQFFLSKEDVEVIENNVQNLNHKEKFLILTKQFHTLVKYTKPWQYKEN